MKETTNQEELLQLGRTLLRLRSTMGADHFKNVFREMTFLDYEVLNLLVQRMNLHTADKIYLSEVCKELDVPIQRVSAMVKNLQGKGLVYWTHDNSGKGTYIKLSELGKEAMEAQRQILIQYFTAVVEHIGIDELKNTLERMEALEDVMIEMSQNI